MVGPFENSLVLHFHLLRQNLYGSHRLLKDTICIRRLFYGFYPSNKSHTIIFEDNQSCLKLIETEKLSNRTKHIYIQNRILLKTILKRKYSLANIVELRNQVNLFTYSYITEVLNLFLPLNPICNFVRMPFPPFQDFLQ